MLKPKIHSELPPSIALIFFCSLSSTVFLKINSSTDVFISTKSKGVFLRRVKSCVASLSDVSNNQTHFIKESVW